MCARQVRQRLIGKSDRGLIGAVGSDNLGNSIENPDSVVGESDADGGRRSRQIHAQAVASTMLDGVGDDRQTGVVEQLIGLRPAPEGGASKQPIPNLLGGKRSIQPVCLPGVLDLGQ